MLADFPLRTVIFKFHDYTYLRAQLVNLVMDLVQVLMLHVNAHRLVIASTNFKCYEYIFSGTIGKPGAPKLAIEQSGPFSHVPSECIQIFHSINSFFNFTTIYIYNLVIQASGPRLVELLNLQ